MNCLNKKTLNQYVKNELNEEDLNKAENHLYECDDCLASYMDALQEYENQLPIMDHPSQFTDEVVVEIRASERCEKKRSRQNPLIHYVVAAGFTLILMFSGVFDSLTTIVSDDTFNVKEAGSFSNGVLDRTVNMIEGITKDQREGNK